MKCLVDTNVLSEYFKGKNPLILGKAAIYLSQYGKFAFSLITYYEITRGLKATLATTKLNAFLAFCRKAEILPLPRRVIDIGADLWAELRRAGRLIQDTDILIAATALRHGLGLATRNVSHFRRVPGLTIEDWSVP